MKNRWTVFGLCIIGLLLVSFSGNEWENGNGGRLIIKRILEAEGMEIYKDEEESSLTFLIDPNDSIRINCFDCQKALSKDQNKRGAMGLTMHYSGFEQELKPSDFSKFIFFEAADGKLTLSFNRDGYGKDIALIRSIGIFAKRKEGLVEEKGRRRPKLKIKGLYFEQMYAY